MFNNARSEVIIVSPFIKRCTFDRLVAAIPDNVKLTCFTRWRLQEIASGVSDPSIWEVIKIRGNSSLWLRHDLHAKYYRVDGECVVGSANLTDAGLGWRRHPNLEILAHPADPSVLRNEFENLLSHSAIAVDEVLYQHVLESSAKLSGLDEQFWHSASDQIAEVVGSKTAIDDDKWLPETRHPEDLFLAYTKDTSRLTTASQSTTAKDLKHFMLPPELPQEVFDCEISIQLLEKPLIRQIDAYLSQPRRFGEVSALISKFLSDPSGADVAWQTTIRWLRHFLRKRYALAVPSHSEIMYRVM